MKIDKLALPRLAYISDVPIEASYHGSALIYRLLQNYPTKQLRIIEGDLLLSLPERRLPRVNYSQLKFGRKRWLNTRFHRWISSWYSLMARGRARKIPELLGDFKPQAVLTVAHGYSWITAAAYAAKCDIPLHFIIHDDWQRVANLVGPMLSWLDRKFGSVYRNASSRLCVSPFMAEEYSRRYGMKGEVLYPSRGGDTPVFSEPPDRLKKPRQGLVVAFAGSISMPDYFRSISKLAKCLESFNGQLFIYGPLTKEHAAAANLNRSNIRLQGLLTSKDLMKQLRDEVDVLFVPMSFDSRDRSNMELSFPSKLTDYTAVGLPLLIYGPTYCSAVRWARENPGVAEVVDNNENDALAVAVRYLTENGGYRMQLAISAIAAGKRYFSHEAAWPTFSSALLREQ